MTLGELLRRLPGARLEGSPTIAVSGITHDSRRVRPGWIFAACPGARSHGADFAAEAVSRGASTVLSDRAPDPGLAVAWITAADPRTAMAAAAWALFGDPQEQLQLVAVTGTNGKTTTADLISRILQAHGMTTGLFGTLGYRLVTTTLAAQRTTPEATDLAPMLRELVEGGGDAAVMEVSSHALVQRRVAGLGFDIAVWTNLSRDHLDFHGDMESYFAAKRSLFEDHLAEGGRRVLPSDDPWASRLLAEPRLGDVSWGVEAGTVTAAGIEMNLEGTRLTLCLPEAELPMHLPLLGVHNLRNAIAAAAAAHAAAIPAETIVRGLEGARPLAGRLEPVPTELGFPVFVDYAHTPDGLRSVLEALRRVTDRTLYVVFGAGGDRDAGKRGPMGRAAGELADVVIVTSDNPRSEDPQAIAAAVAEGVRAAGAEPELILDRRQAIASALDRADASSVVLVAGKGHEEIQIIGDRQLPFSDRAVIRQLAGLAEVG